MILRLWEYINSSLYERKKEEERINNENGHVLFVH